MDITAKRHHSPGGEHICHQAAATGYGFAGCSGFVTPYPAAPNSTLP